MLLLVYGWYGRHNLGDQLMSRALRALFEPRGCELRFVDRLRGRDVSDCDGVVFGGGSILFDAPDVDPVALSALLARARPVFYLGIGAETGVHPTHRALLSVSKAVVVRSPESLEVLPSAQLATDLVYSLPVTEALPEAGSGLLVVPNVEVVPMHSSPHWAHVGWERFKDELAQALDVLIEEHGIRPSFLLMCRNDRMDDAWPAAEVVARMANRRTDFETIRVADDDLDGALKAIGRHACVVTQRYHGIVLAQLAGVPHVSVAHHDKLKQAWPELGTQVTYHGVTKKQLVQSVSCAASLPRVRPNVDAKVYDQVADAVVTTLVEGRNARGKEG